MQVRVQSFGALRESLGSERFVEAQDGETVANVLKLLAAEQSGLLDTCAVAVNLEYVSRDYALHAGDEVSLLPPVSGGTNPHVALVREPIVAADLLSRFAHGTDGAVITFEGIVRNNTKGRPTLHLDYEAFEPMALKQMHELAETAMQQHDIRDVLMVHRLGRIDVGETSVLIVVASAHRAPAFAACRWLIDTLKQRVPIWKKEQFCDGAVWADGEPFPEALAK